MVKLIEEKTREIRDAMGALGRRLENGDDSELLYWVIPDKLACAHRPLRHHPRYGGSGRNLDHTATHLVCEWAEKIKHSGIKSIICLMHKKDLNYYSSLKLETDDLIKFYKKQGFNVCHLPWEDPLHSKANEDVKKKKLLEIRNLALPSYRELPKPVMIQCSAGIDRSSPVAAFICVNECERNF